MKSLFTLMQRRFPFILVLLVVIGCAQVAPEYRTSTADGENCSLSLPPIDSGRNSLHGTYLFVYPRALSDHYSGCQTMWDQTGRKWMELHLTDGQPTKLDIRLLGAQEKSTEFSCVYRNHKLMGDTTKCPPYEEGQPFGNLAFLSEEIKPTDNAYQLLLRLQQRVP